MLIECSNCGAPLDVKGTERTAKCRYCSARNRLRETRTLSADTPPEWEPPSEWTPPEEFDEPSVAHPYKKPSSPNMAFGIVLLGVLGCGIVIATTPGTEGEAKKGECATPAECVTLGLRYATGDGVAKDQDKAIALYRQACDDGEPYGCGNLAARYFHANGVEKDLAKAAALYRKACDGGNPDGCYGLGWMHATGTEVKRDDAEAEALYRRACDRGSKKACEGVKEFDVKAATRKRAAALKAWDGKTNLECDAGKVVIDPAPKAAPGVSVTVEGTCNLTLVKADVFAPVAVVVRDRGSLTLEGGTFRADKKKKRHFIKDVGTAIVVEGRGRLQAHKTTLRGVWSGLRVKDRATARLRDVTVEQAEVPEGGVGWYPVGIRVSGPEKKARAIIPGDHPALFMEGGRVRWTGHGVLAGPTEGTVVMRNVDVAAEKWFEGTPNAVAMGGGAPFVSIVGGTLAAGEVPLDVGFYASATVEGVDIKGKTEVNPTAFFTEEKTIKTRSTTEAFAALQAIRPKRIKRMRGRAATVGAACRYLEPCLFASKYVGEIRGKITMNVGKDGKLTEVVTTGLVASEIGACIKRRNEKDAIRGHAGEAGKLSCEFSGKMKKAKSIRGGGETTRSFVPSK